VSCRIKGKKGGRKKGSKNEKRAKRRGRLANWFEGDPNYREKNFASPARRRTKNKNKKKSKKSES